MQTLSRSILLFAHAVLLLVWADWSGDVISKDINIFIVFAVILSYILGSISVLLHGLNLGKFIVNKYKTKQA